MTKFFNVKKLKKGDYLGIAEILEKGGVVIFPTDTVYGLCCSATSSRAVNKILKIKDRPSGKGMPMLVKDFKMLDEYAIFDKVQKQIIRSTKRSTTFRLNNKNLPKNVLENKTGAFRIPKKKFIQDLFKYFDKPIVATSANLSGQETLRDPKKYIEIFGEKSKLVDLVVSEGICKRKRPSKIVDLTSKNMDILRR